jgi:hypothetical protein
MSIYEEFRELLYKAIEEEKEALVNGNVKDFSDFRYRTGKINGLRDSMAIFKDVVDKMQDED